MKKIRIDKLLVSKKLTQSRQRAVFLINEGKVFVNGQQITKPSIEIDEESNIEIRGEDIKWVSRGGLKLEQALKVWNIKPENWVCMDIGASTGGFTDVLIDNGAMKVYAIDVGHGQLAQKLRDNPKVINLEGTNIRHLSKKVISELVDMVCIDVAFISLTLVIPEVIKFLKPNGIIIALIKPQFEVGRKRIGKGIVRKSEYHDLAIQKITSSLENYKLVNIGIIESPILGGEGNKEFLIYLKRK